ncbi:DUF6167 family protein [Aeromicrobium endophyticum]|uniref:Secreted protein n=1 Tax=Aeromicrobium endophyticum TaxID=2292704 RepID=A0A371P219_9ACTN|nr:DUF6167 family protein [Aeromicrobium endophyticum]REK70004.1 hypothetical protein DX116_12530 [Aeromicrobium endophyticum]
MRSRLVWFVAGSAAGVYTAAKARRAAYRLSAPGVVDQAAALGLGWRELSAEVRDGMLARERQIARQLADAPAADALRLDEARPDHELPETIRPDVTHPDPKAT